MPAASPDPAFVLRAHDADAQAICFSADGSLLYSGDAAGVLIVWSLERRRPAFQSSAHPPEAGIISLHYLPGQPPSLISQGRDGTLKLWRLGEQGLPEGRPAATVQTFSFSFCRCSVRQHAAWPPGGGRTTLVALAGSQDGDAEVWRDLESSPRLDRAFRQPEGAMKCGMCMAVRFVDGEGSHGGSPRLLLAGYEDGTLALWDPAQAAAPLATAKPHAEPVMALAVRGSEAFSGSAEDCVFSLALACEPPRLAARWRLLLAQAGTADLALRGDGRLLAVAGWDGRVRLFSRKTGAALAVLKYHRAGVAAVAFDPATGWLASAGRDNAVAFWDVYSG